MDSVINLLNGFATALNGWNIIYCVIGVTVGMLVGILPGLGPVTAIALLLPITFKLSATPAIIMLAGIYYGSMYGGTVTSVLINVPGEAASVVTCFDGYAMAKQGRAGTALGVAAIGSFIGGTVAVIGLTLIGPPLARLALGFGPQEFFAIMVLGLAMLMGLIGKSLIRGMLSAFIGLSIALIGMDPMTGLLRFTFGEPNLMEGLDFVVIAMGLFGISEVMLGYEASGSSVPITKISKLFPERHEWKPTMGAIGRGTVLGFFLGLIPGANAVIASVLSYSLEKKISKDPSRFGHGAIEGVAGPETANNAFSGAAMIPLFTMGIPTSPTVAILFGAFIMHGLTPGPALFQSNPDLVWGIIASMYIGNVVLLIFNLPLARLWAKITQVPESIMYPAIVAISVVGAYSVSGSLFQVGVMIISGIVGYIFKKVDIPLAPLVLTFVLGKLMESTLAQSMIYFEGNFFLFFTRPIAGTVLVIAILVLVFSFVSVIKGKRGRLASDTEI
ncbi:MAG: tripartite tricarboxylate transporter permease [Spirochaetales bacterium]